MELVAVSRLQRSRHAWRTQKQRRQHCIAASLAGEHKVLVEWCFQCARIGDAEHSIRRLDAVGDTQARLSLTGYSQTVIEIAANSNIEKPVPGLDLILEIESHLLNVGMAKVVEITSSASEVIGQQDRIERTGIAVALNHRRVV